METQTPTDETVEEIDDASFFPKGALAFFILLIVFFAILWFSMYFEILARQ